MTDTERELAELECEMNALVGLRNQRVTVGQEMIDRANRDFDEQAIPLGRRINRLRSLLETEKQIDSLSRAATTPIVTVTRTVRESTEPDPEWSQEDIDHFKELRGRESHKARSARGRTA
jgi:hypothetical protein